VYRPVLSLFVVDFLSREACIVSSSDSAVQLRIDLQDAPGELRSSSGVSLLVVAAILAFVADGFLLGKIVPHSL
jgi:hypothetical protein